MSVILKEKIQGRSAWEVSNWKKMIHGFIICLTTLAALDKAVLHVQQKGEHSILQDDFPF